MLSRRLTNTYMMSLRLLTLACLISLASTAQAQEKITYLDHVRPIVVQSCINCHNADKSSGGLDLSSYNGVMSGGSSGKAINPGDPEGSLLYRLVTHQQEPFMPQRGSKLSDAHLATLRKWIEGGALETADSTPIAMAPKQEMKLEVSTANRPEGPPPMPENLRLEPYVRADRPGAAGAIAASPWAPLVALAGQGQILLYHTDTRELLGILPFHHGLPKVLSFSRNGKLLLAGGGQSATIGYVALFDVTTGKQIKQIGDEFDEVLAADLRADHSMVALGGSGKIVKIFSTSDGEMLHRLTPHTDWITAIAYSPDAVLLASGDRAGGLRVWEAQSAAEFYTLAGHKGMITDLAFRPDSNVLASASEDGTVKLWNMNDGKEIKSIAAHGSGALSVDFAHDGRIVTAGRDRVVRVWKADGEKISDLEPARDIALHAVFTHDGAHLITDDWLGEVRVLALADGKKVATLDLNPPTLGERIAAVRPAFEQAQAAYDEAVAKLLTAEEKLTKAPDTEKEAATIALQEAKHAVALSSKKLDELREELARWKNAQQVADLAAAQDQLAQLAANQQQVLAALEQIKTSTAILQEHPAKIAALEKRLSEAKAAQEARVAALSAAEALAGERGALLAEAQALLKTLEESSAKTPQDESAAAALAAARDAAKHLSTSADAAQAQLSAAKQASDSAAADVTAADAELGTLRTQLEQAPAQLEAAQKLIAQAASAPVAELKAKVEALTPNDHQ